MESTYNQGLFIIFPSFKTKAIIGATDIYMDIKPFTLDSTAIVVKVPEYYTSIPTSSSTTLPLHLNVHHETYEQNKLLPELHHQHNMINTKRQLKLNVPAGFCHRTLTQ